MSVVTENGEVIISNTTTNGEAMNKGLNPGDIIREVNQKPVTTAKQAKKLIGQAQNAGKQSILLLIDPQGIGEARFVALKLKKEK